MAGAYETGADSAAESLPHWTRWCQLGIYMVFAGLIGAGFLRGLPDWAKPALGAALLLGVALGPLVASYRARRRRRLTRSGRQSGLSTVEILATVPAATIAALAVPFSHWSAWLVLDCMLVLAASVSADACERVAAKRRRVGRDVHAA